MSGSGEREQRLEEWIFLALVALATLILMVELLSLYSTPVPDSYLWWGDESWLMIEFRTQMQTGIFCYPYALGSTLAAGSGMIFGNMWMPALLYGIPTVLIPPAAMDIVLVGRTVTAVLAVTLVFVLFEAVRRITADRLLALLSVFLLITSHSFLFTSHSARYDILSALAILFGTYILIRYRAEQPWHIILAGAITAATLLVTIHVTLALAVAAIATIAYRSKGNWAMSVALFLAGAFSFAGLLAAVTFLRGLPLLSPSIHGAFALNIHDIPALRFYSRSVQTANLFQRWHTALELGTGYVLVYTVLVALCVIQLIRKKIAIRVEWRAVLFAIVLLSWMELESAAPTSYLIYILPILSIAAALALERLYTTKIRMWFVAAFAVLLAALALRDMPGPHGKGYRITSENYEAVGTALSQIEDAEPGSSPLVLAITPAVHEALRDTNVRLMTTQFIEFPQTSESVDSVLRDQHVGYALVYISQIKPDYMREVNPILHALDSDATPLWERAGYFTDIGRSYFNSSLGPPDTIRLYKLHE